MKSAQETPCLALFLSKEIIMTLEEIRASEKPVLIPTDIAPVLGCDPQWIRDTARQVPHALGFPVIVIGARVKIPRLPFLRFMGINT